MVILLQASSVYKQGNTKLIWTYANVAFLLLTLHSTEIHVKCEFVLPFYFGICQIAVGPTVACHYRGNIRNGTLNQNLVIPNWWQHTFFNMQEYCFSFIYFKWITFGAISHQVCRGKDHFFLANFIIMQPGGPLAQQSEILSKGISCVNTMAQNNCRTISNLLPHVASGCL